MTAPNYPASPPWSPNSKRIVWAFLAAMLLLGIYRMRGLLLPLIMALVVSYLVEPVVKLITRRTPLSRNIAIVLVYLIIVAALVSIPVSVISPLVNQANNLINNTPHYLEQLGVLLQRPYEVSGIEIPLDQLPLEQVYVGLSNNLVTLMQTVGSRSLSLFGSVATATLSTVGWTIIVLFLSFYMVKDHDSLFRSIVNLVPEVYQPDFYRLSQELSITWNAFLRGQLVLCVVVGAIIFFIAVIIDLPNAMILAIIAGIAELVPTFGPILAAVPAALIALFQSQASWVGSSMSPFWFMMLVLAIYSIVFQLENYYLLPRIIGHHLKLHPLVIIIGALVGASVAGFLGILLAAPTLASARLIFDYIYCKLTDRPPFSKKIIIKAVASERRESKPETT
ncbi:MAG: AI-2E family transporter [Anaerolineae bacterium]